MATVIPQFTNHIGFVVDRSSSMGHLSKQVVEVFDAQITHLRNRSIELNQETRVCVYLFADTVECVVFDMDVMRMPSLRTLYAARGSTALMDATGQSVQDMRKIPELYSDHAFLLYVLTDGEENVSRKFRPNTLRTLIDGLPNNWTVACMVPNLNGKHEAKQFGFPEGNIEIWSTDVRGLETAGKTITTATDNFMVNRAKGVRGTRSLFTTDLSTVSVKDVQSKLQELKGGYRILSVPNTSEIRPFVESAAGIAYSKGCAFYRLEKTETIQGYKEIAVRNKKTGKVFSGPNARQVLGLPDFDTRVSPGDHGDWDIFIQSTSVNRKLLSGTEVLVMTA